MRIVVAEKVPHKTLLVRQIDCFEFGGIIKAHPVLFTHTKRVYGAF